MRLQEKCFLIIKNELKESIRKNAEIAAGRHFFVQWGVDVKIGVQFTH